MNSRTRRIHTFFFYHNRVERLAAKVDQNDFTRLDIVQQSVILKITVSFKLPWRETITIHRTKRKNNLICKVVTDFANKKKKVSNKIDP